MGSWNIPSLLEDRQLPYSSNELKTLNVDIVELSKMRYLGEGKISLKMHVQSFAVKVTSVDEYIM